MHMQANICTGFSPEIWAVDILRPGGEGCVVRRWYRVPLKIDASAKTTHVMSVSGRAHFWSYHALSETSFVFRCAFQASKGSVGVVGDVSTAAHQEENPDMYMLHVSTASPYGQLKAEGDRASRYCTLNVYWQVIRIILLTSDTNVRGLLYGSVD